MNTENRNLDDLLRCHAERQLRDFDWDRQREIVLGRVAATSAREGRSGGAFRTTIARASVGVAAVLLLTIGYLSYLHFRAVGPDATGRSGTPAGESAAADNLLASTDPETILLRGPMRLLAANDPLLSPPSMWDQ